MEEDTLQDSFTKGIVGEIWSGIKFQTDSSTISYFLTLQIVKVFLDGY